MSARNACHLIAPPFPCPVTQVVCVTGVSGGLVLEVLFGETVTSVIDDRCGSLFSAASVETSEGPGKESSLPFWTMISTALSSETSIDGIWTENVTIITCIKQVRVEFDEISAYVCYKLKIFTSFVITMKVLYITAKIIRDIDITEIHCKISGMCSLFVLRKVFIASRDTKLLVNRFIFAHVIW